MFYVPQSNVCPVQLQPYETVPILLVEEFTPNVNHQGLAVSEERLPMCGTKSNPGCCCWDEIQK